ncbi:Protein Cms1 [Dillenia turbinata]|uniref:Protein Cms1 n=1 Tax=Dillenia turbinata TaxID=194707 RepID=A0AAN8YYP5_9MAGN
MGSKKAEIAKKSFLKRRKHLAPNKPNTKNKQEKKKKKKKQQKKDNIENKKQIQEGVEAEAVVVSASQQLSFFVDNFQASNAVQLSSLELASLKGIDDNRSVVGVSGDVDINDMMATQSKDAHTCILEPPDGLDQDADVLVEQIKAAFGQSWKEVLCEGETSKGKVDPGTPAVLIISTSALRSLELIRAVRALTRDCHAAKLFSKHMKVEEQVSVLKTRVNTASGTPSRGSRVN